MPGGGKHYEDVERQGYQPADFLVEARKERIAEVVAHRTRSVTVVLDRLEDTFNMAAVLRTCEGLGLQDVHIIEHPEQPFRPHRKVNQGCDKWLDIHPWKDFASCRAWLKEQGYQVWVSAVQEDSRPLRELRFDTRMALVFGNERSGVSAEALEGADGVFWIPMRGFVRSFNISVAVTATISRALLWREEHLGVTGDLSTEEAAELTERFQRLSVRQHERIFREPAGG